MNVFIERFSATRAADEHAVMALDQAGWHASRQLRVPENVTLVPLPPYSPHLNPVERVWLDLRWICVSAISVTGFSPTTARCSTRSAARGTNAPPSGSTP